MTITYAIPDVHGCLTELRDGQLNVMRYDSAAMTSFL